MPPSEDNDLVELISTTPSHQPAKKHPFFMAPTERAVRRLTEQISESNALNRAIRINLLSEDGESGEETELELSHENTDKNKNSKNMNSFFQKRTKFSSNGTKGGCCNLKRISSNPPLPREFQLISQSSGSSGNSDLFNFESRFTKRIEPPVLITIPNADKVNSAVPLSQLLRSEYSNMSGDDLKRLNSSLNNRSLDAVIASQFKNPNVRIMRTILNEIEISENSPVLWVITGPTGSGKTRLVEDLREKLGFKLITIDSTQSPRNSKTFETLLTTLSHSTPDAFTKNFFASSNSMPARANIAILFDEVEIAFESDRGYWTALSAFLQTITTKSASHVQVPVFITSNASRSFLESIIKFPDHAQFIENDLNPDFRGFINNSDIINRLHRLDTSSEYEHFALNTGYYKRDNTEISLKSDSKSIISEALNWNGFIENVHLNTSCFEYAECSSLADILLSNKNENSFEGTSSLLYSTFPEIYETNNQESIRIARDLIERTISTSVRTIEQYQHRDHFNYQCYHRDLSKMLLKRFNDYMQNLSSHHIWKSELTQHVALIEGEYYAFGRVRRKRAYYRYLGEELFNEILQKKSER